jgi:hypothetical protein
LVKIEDLINLPSYYIYVKLLVDGKPTNSFLAKTLLPPPKPEISFRDEIINLNHLKYTKRRSLVEGKIARIYAQVKKESELVYCVNCRQPFLSQGEDICEECQEKIKAGISLKKAVETEIIVEKKKIQSYKTKNLDEILKKIKNES